MSKHGKKYEAALKLFDATKEYDLKEACEIVKKTSVTKFEGGVSLSISLNIDTTQADQQIRGTVVLPNGTGKSVRVCAITTKIDDAKAAGADYAGGKELLAKILGGWFDFDVMCATPEMMGEIGKAGRVLGPKGLMPNPKIGTVGPDVKKMVTELKAGKVEYRADKDGNINILVGKVSFAGHTVAETLDVLINEVLELRPSVIKGVYIMNSSIHTTMGPSVKIAIVDSAK